MLLHEARSLPGIGGGQALKHQHSVCCGCHTHNTSFAETSVGPDISTELSRDEQSHELHFSSQQDTLAGGQSMMTVGTDSFLELPSMEYQHSLLQLQLQEETEQYDRSAHEPRILEKSSLATLMEIPRLPLGRLPLPCKKSQKLVLCITPAPHHRCVAFDGIAFEDVRGRQQEAARLLDPSTKKLFNGIRDAGKFPRRWLRGSGHGGIGQEDPDADAAGPWTAREVYPADRKRRMLEDNFYTARGGSASPPSAQLLPSLGVGLAAVPSTPQAGKALSSNQPPRNLKDFFPASAR